VPRQGAVVDDVRRTACVVDGDLEFVVLIGEGVQRIVVRLDMSAWLRKRGDSHYMTSKAPSHHN
jgi:hypothetical protein